MEMRSVQNKNFIEHVIELFTPHSRTPLEAVNSTQSQPVLPLQPKTSDLSGGLPRPNLIARWEIEDGKLVCRWIVGDRSRNSSTHS